MAVIEYLLPRWLIALRTIDPDTSAVLSSGSTEHLTGHALAGTAEIGFLEGDLATGALVARPDHGPRPRRAAARRVSPRGPARDLPSIASRG